ncbi:MAG: hypothetical protein JXC32_17035 [Anaerolineae bacterium]|nr:hypothetical protein [Anaerolineae bacterium]
MREPRERYLSYLLRLWQVWDEEGPTWRASLESTATGDRQGFVSLDGLFGFLRRLTDEIEAFNRRKGNRR